MARGVSHLNRNKLEGFISYFGQVVFKEVVYIKMFNTKRPRRMECCCRRQEDYPVHKILLSVW